jgi:predicted DNA-binding protein
VRIRGAAITHNVTLITTVSAAMAAAEAIKAVKTGEFQVHSIQELHKTMVE